MTAVKTTASTPVDEVHNEQRVAIRLTIGSWSEETFTPIINLPNHVVTVPEFNWDDIEAVGAADDASRFRIDSPLEELTGSCV